MALNRFNEHPLTDYYHRLILFAEPAGDGKRHWDELLFTWTAEMTMSGYQETDGCVSPLGANSLRGAPVIGGALMRWQPSEHSKATSRRGR
jgi:hypothetical protein